MNIKEKPFFQVLECLFKMDMFFQNLENAESTIKRVQKDFKTEDVVIKAQIHAGGRGKGGGVKYCRNFEEALESAKQIFGMNL